MDDIFRLI